MISDVPAGELTATRDDLFDTPNSAVADAGRTILPMRFGTIMPDERPWPLGCWTPVRTNSEQLLEELDGRVELTLRRCLITNPILREVVAENPEIARLNERVRNRSPEAAYYERIRLGELVSSSLQAKRELDAGQSSTICSHMRST